MINNILIVYFSRAGNNYVNGQIVSLPVGNTEIAAKKVGLLTHGMLFPLEPTRPYSPDYERCIQEAKKDLLGHIRPKLTHTLGDINGFDTLVLCYPNYWGTMPMPMWTFLERYNFSGKTILPVCTHEGSGLGNSERDLKRLCPTARIKKGLAIKGSYVNNAGEMIRDWLRENQLLCRR